MDSRWTPCVLKPAFHRANQCEQGTRDGLEAHDAELAFRDEIRSWLRAHLPPALSSKVRQGQRLTKAGPTGLGAPWAAKVGMVGWPSAFGGPGWNAVQKHLFKEECARRAPRIVPFGPVMVAPVIMAFGTAEQQQRFLPGIRAGGLVEPGL